MRRSLNILSALMFFLACACPFPALAGDLKAVPLDGGAKPLDKLFAQAAPAGTGTEAIFPDARWTAWENPASRGWVPAALSAAGDQFHALGATGLVVVDNGRVVAEWGDTARNVNCHSVRKSLLSALYGIEASKGAIDLSATLADLNIDDRGGISPAEKKASLSDLLKARSGVYHPAAYETASMQKKRPARGSHAPGTFWYYNNWDFNALGTIYREKTGRDIFQSFHDQIAVPIGMQDFRPDDCRYHHEKASDHPAYLFLMSARDRARFGLLFMNGGRWKGRQVIPGEWVRESTTSWSKAGKGIGYGYLWWVSTGRYHLTNKIRGQAFSARGNWGQYIVVLPAHGIVVALSTDKSAGAPKISNRQFGGLLKLILRSNSNYLATLGGS